MKGAVMVVLVVMGMAQLMCSPSEAAVTCEQVNTSLRNCISYLVAGGTPSPACCGGVKDLANVTPTTTDRQAACSCIKAAAAKVPNINQDAATSLPQKCAVPLTFPSPGTSIATMSSKMEACRARNNSTTRTKQSHCGA